MTDAFAKDFLIAVLGVAPLALLLRLVWRRSQDADARDAARYRALRSVMELQVGEDADLVIGAVLLRDWERSVTDDDHEVITARDVPFLTADEVAAVNGNALVSCVSAGDTIDRAVDWWRARQALTMSSETWPHV